MTLAIVNGYPCRDCTDIGYAIKHIDPVRPSDGPYGISAPPWSGKTATDTAPDQDSVYFGGALALSRQAGRGTDGSTVVEPDDTRRSGIDTLA